MTLAVKITGLPETEAMRKLCVAVAEHLGTLYFCAGPIGEELPLRLAGCLEAMMESLRRGHRVTLELYEQP